jgi:hypothetical protein
VRKEDSSCSLAVLAKAGGEFIGMFYVRKCGELTRVKMSRYLAGLLLYSWVCLIKMSELQAVIEL